MSKNSVRSKSKGFFLTRKFAPVAFNIKFLSYVKQQANYGAISCDG